MARRTIVVSDLTGAEIDERDSAQVIINYADARRGRVVLDVNASEVDDLAAKGTKQARRGRRPKAATE
jgi:hypothetical protein